MRLNLRLPRAHTRQCGYQDANYQHCRQPGDLQHPADDGAIFSGCRIVVVAVENHLVHQVANLVVGSLNQAQSQILWREINSVEILRNFAFWSENYYGRSVRELLVLLIELVAEPNCFG